MDYNVHKICRVCLEEGAQTSIYSTEFAMMPSAMIMMCAKIRVYKTDGLPAVICNNCIYRLGVAYHFKQECENSDMRLRQYLGLPDRSFGFCDTATNTEIELKPQNFIRQRNALVSSDDDDELVTIEVSKCKRRTRYQRKPPEEHKKRGPKPLPKLPQTCYDCNKSFKCAAQLQQHIRTHTGEKPYACSHCSQRFAQKYNLKVHERMHTGEKPFQCEICSKQFSALGNFQAHQKIHTGIRDQLCPVCQKAFYTAGDVSKHMTTHTGIKSHHCDICGKAFSRLRDMRAHKRKLHPLQEPIVDDIVGDDDDDIDTDPVGVDTLVHDHFKCPDCDRTFDTADNLNLHFRAHASNNLLSLPLAAATTVAAHHTYHHAVVPPAHEGLHHATLQAPPPPPPNPTQMYTMFHHSAQRLHY